MQRLLFASLSRSHFRCPGGRAIYVGDLGKLQFQIRHCSKLGRRITNTRVISAPRGAQLPFRLLQRRLCFTLMNAGEFYLGSIRDTSVAAGPRQCNKALV
ncbi:hypothetical protein D3C86_1956730 [compost metagenome]